MGKREIFSPTTTQLSYPAAFYPVFRRNSYRLMNRLIVAVIVLYVQLAKYQGVKRLLILKTFLPYVKINKTIIDHIAGTK